MLNDCNFIGHLGADPELRHTQNGIAVASLSVAVNEKWRDKGGQLQEHTEWVRVSVWGAQAEHCQRYLAKGRMVFVKGKLRTRKWTDKDGQDRWTTEINASNVQFLGSGERRDAGQGSPQGQRGGYAQQPAPAPDYGDDDIPF